MTATDGAAVAVAEAVPVLAPLVSRSPWASFALPLLIRTSFMYRHAARRASSALLRLLLLPRSSLPAATSNT